MVRNIFISYLTNIRNYRSPRQASLEPEPHKHGTDDFIKLNNSFFDVFGLNKSSDEWV